ncbi:MULTISPECIES: App1 family protein [unclassified Luteococcus]|uniref:App1 family protein n=1 Tax=unclassified Luteococcus TaxID=2639923 RepID=UPI00313EAD81
MSTRPFIGARAEEFVTRRVSSRLEKAHWRPSVIPFRGYGTQDHVRVLARVVQRPAEPQTQLGIAADSFLTQRGWRNFVAVPVPRAEVTVRLRGSQVEVRADRGGYVDVRLRIEGLEPGEHEAEVVTQDGRAKKVPIQVVSNEETFGLVSDLDDTVISTSLPRLFIAAWNSFVVTEEGRRAVPGMARMYQQLLAEHPGAPVIYVSTGSWNTHPFLSRFLERHGFPTGAMLLTDWGPTNTGWFRSGPDHKRQSLRELARDFPNIRWVLVGDDGQHDPRLYREFAELQPAHVRAIALRELSMTEQVLAHGSTTVLADDDQVTWDPHQTPEVRAPDGDTLWPLLREVLGDDRRA